MIPDLEEKNTEISVFKQSLSMERASSTGGRSSRRSSGYSYVSPCQIDDDESESESQSVSEAGDIGDRALHRNSNGGTGSRSNSSSRFRLSLDHIVGERSVVPISDNFASKSKENTANATVQSLDDDETEEDNWLLKYVSCLALLALFGILGVISRYYLQKLFGPGVIGATSGRSYMYLDLPSNMVGSFLMGWLGVVFKADISKISENLAIGLTTGFLGSLTTFSGWNQKMLDLSVEGHWVFSVLCILIGLLLAASSIVFGIETAKGFKWFWNRRQPNTTISKSSLDKHKNNLIVTTALVLILCGVWAVCSTREATEFKKANDNAQLLFACIVGPFGVWIRWYLARLNGHGIGESGQLKWLPFGTLAANVLAASLMAALAILKKAVKTEACNTVAAGLQLGFLGCLSTVSTFIAEFDAMRRSKHPWRGYAYAIITILISFALGTLIYSLPVWIKGYD